MKILIICIIINVNNSFPLFHPIQIQFEVIESDTAFVFFFHLLLKI